MPKDLVHKYHTNSDYRTSLKRLNELTEVKRRDDRLVNQNINFTKVIEGLDDIDDDVVVRDEDIDEIDKFLAGFGFNADDY